ncbi:MAG: hypothetical protein PHS82_15180 [Lachnospiraceae bacterium]|nr:hypothetical protein [Lachnospiraceae bacterium]
MKKSMVLLGILAGVLMSLTIAYAAIIESASKGADTAPTAATVDDSATLPDGSVAAANIVSDKTIAVKIADRQNTVFWACALTISEVVLAVLIIRKRWKNNNF